MAATSAPYGLVPINLIGSQAFNGGGIREIKMTVNTSNAIYTGDIVTVGSASAGQPDVLTATPTAGTTTGIVGVCVGVRYVDPTMKYSLHAQYLPGGAVTAGYTDIWVKVCDDPDALFMVQANGTVAATKIGRNTSLTNFGGSTTTGRSSIQLTYNAFAGTNTLAVRLVDLVNSTTSSPGDAYTDCIVKLNFGVHSYYFATGATN